MTEGAALAKLQEFLRPLNETAGMRQGLPPTSRRTFQTSTCLNGGRSGRASTDLTTTIESGSTYINAFGEFDLKDLSRDKLQRLLDQKRKQGYPEAW
jgi:predicted DNA-binding WGR domain protein